VNNVCQINIIFIASLYQFTTSNLGDVLLLYRLYVITPYVFWQCTQYLYSIENTYSIFVDQSLFSFSEFARTNFSKKKKCKYLTHNSNPGEYSVQENGIFSLNL